MKVVIVTSCTDKKNSDPDGKLTKEDFERGKEHVRQREEELRDHVLPAQRMYTGQQHTQLMEGVREARKKDSIELDLQIVSAGYGVVSSDREIAPYECAFTGMKKEEAREWAERLQIPEEVQKILSQPHDLGLILLGNDYLDACRLGEDQIVLGGPTLALTSQSHEAKLADINQLRPVPLKTEHASLFSCALVGLKGKIGRLALEGCSRRGKSFVDDLLSSDDVLGELRKICINRVASVTDKWKNFSHRDKLKYFIPEWNDRVDPTYSFENDEHTFGIGGWEKDVYAHQIYSSPNYDGILVSKAVAESTNKKSRLIKKMGVRRYLRVPEDFPIMGDCGAFDYKDAEEPPYETNDMVDYYTRLGFDYGVSIDHLITNADQEDRKFRYNLTKSNAQDFLNRYRELGLNPSDDWTPIGAVQGWDPKSYAAAARELEDMGYNYLGLGGLVRAGSETILDIVDAVRQVIQRQTRLHVFGVARLNIAADLVRRGVTSVDSASCLRQAWMRAQGNYLMPDEKYTAIRIPDSRRSGRIRTAVEETDHDKTYFEGLEQKALDAVRKYAGDTIGIGPTLEALLEYDQYVTEDRVDMYEEYEKTLRDRPWEKCPCPVCREAGVEVLIFRGNNRNRRRGFHNTYVFYEQFRDLVEGVPTEEQLALL